MAKKKYKIILGFTYKGKDGKAKQSEWVRIGPGEEVPELDNNELDMLIMQERIAEISSETGEVIHNKKITTLNDTEIERFMGKSVAAIVAAISSEELSIETLGKMLVIAERQKMDVKIKNAVEEKINAKVSA